jgi:putative ABC transport system permease protein
MLQDHQIRDYRVTADNTEIPDPLLFLAKPDSILISRGMAESNNAGMDKTMEIETVRGLRSFTVRGLLEPVGPAKTMSDSLAIMDIYAAQMAFGKEGRIDRIDVAILRGEDLDAVRKRLQAILPEAYIVQSPAVRSGQIEAIISNLRRNISSLGFVAMCMGMYLIYNAVSITVVHRRKEIGILRALGTNRRWIVQLFLVETLAISIIGSALGIGFGILLAQGSMEAFGQNIAAQYQLNNPTSAPLVISSEHIVTGFILGMLTSILAALFPAFAGARITPVSAIRSLPFSEEEFVSRRKLLLLSFLLLTATAAMLLLYGTTKLVPPGYIVLLIITAEFFLLFGVSFGIPSVLRKLISLFQRFIAPRFGAVTSLAGLNIRKNINRNAVATGAVFLAIALFIAISNIVFSMRGSVMHWLETTSNSDLFITSGHTFSGHTGRHVPMPLAMRDEIERIEGVRFTDMYRQTFIPFNGSKILVESVDVRRRLEYSSFMVAKGDAAGISRLLPDRENVLVSETLAIRHNIKPGDYLILAAPGGPVRFGVAAIIVDFGYEFGAVMMDTATYQRHWHDPLADIIMVLVTKEHDIDKVRGVIEKQLGKQKRLFILSMEEYKQAGQKLLDEIYGIFHVMDVLALSIACIGIIITLLASVLERTREIGIIRSMGAFKGQLSRVVVLESVLLGLTGTLLGIVCGTVLGWMGTAGFVNGEAGMTVPYLIDYHAILKAIVLAVVLSALAGLYPARQAANTNIVKALAYE